MCLRNFATTLRVCKIVVLLCNRARIDGSSSDSRSPTAERRLTIVVPCYTKRKNNTLGVRALGKKNGSISTLRCHKMVIFGVEACGSNFSKMFAGLAGVPRRGLPVETACRATVTLKETPVIQTWVSRPSLDHITRGPDLDHTHLCP